MKYSFIPYNILSGDGNTNPSAKRKHNSSSSSSTQTTTSKTRKSQLTKTTIVTSALDSSKQNLEEGNNEGNQALTPPLSQNPFDGTYSFSQHLNLNHTQQPSFPTTKEETMKNRKKPGRKPRIPPQFSSQLLKSNASNENNHSTMSYNCSLEYPSDVPHHEEQSNREQVALKSPNTSCKTFVQNETTSHDHTQTRFDVPPKEQHFQDSMNKRKIIRTSISIKELLNHTDSM